MSGATPLPGRWSMAARAFLCQNVASGCAFGAFGVTVIPLQEKFDISRGMATLGLALAVLVIGISAPFVATLIGRVGLRRTMSTGVVISGAGYTLLAIAPNIELILIAYALPIGVGLTMFGPFPSTVLTSGWFGDKAGGALGFVNMPVFIALLPIVGQLVIRDYDLPTLYLILAGLHLLLLPIALGIKDAPSIRGSMEGPADAPAADVPMPAATLLRLPIFWLIALGAGALHAAAISGLTHLFAFGIERGIAAEQSALLLSLLGGASVVGSLLLGILVGRIGPLPALATLGIGFALSWIVFLLTSGFPFMAAAAIAVGACGAGVYPATSVLGAALFGQASLARVMGLLSLLMMPCTVCLPPLAGVLRDRAGSYEPVAMSIIGGTIAVAILFALLARFTTPPTRSVATI